MEAEDCQYIQTTIPNTIDVLQDKALIRKKKKKASSKTNGVIFDCSTSTFPIGPFILLFLVSLFGCQVYGTVTVNLNPWIYFDGFIESRIKMDGYYLPQQVSQVLTLMNVSDGQFCNECKIHPGHSEKFYKTALVKFHPDKHLKEKEIYTPLYQLVASNTALLRNSCSYCVPRYCSDGNLSVIFGKCKQ